MNAMKNAGKIVPLIYYKTTIYCIILVIFGIILFYAQEGAEAEFDFQVEQMVTGIPSIQSFTVSPDGGNICIIQPQQLSLYNITTDEIYLEKHFGFVSIIDGCWVGDKIIITMGNRESDDWDPIRVLSASDLSRFSGTAPKDDIMYEIEESSSGDMIAVSWKNELFVLTVVDLQVIYHKDEHKNVITAIAWSPNESRVATAGWQGDILVHDIIENKTLKMSENSVRSVELQWSLDGRELINIDASGEVHIIDPITGSTTDSDQVTTGNDAGDINFLIGYMCLGSKNQLDIYGVGRTTVLQSMKEPVGEIVDIEWDLAGARIIAASSDGMVRIYLDTNHPSYNNPPMISIEKPTDDEIINSDFLASGTITDDLQVLFSTYQLNNGQWILLENPSSWTIQIKTSDLKVGSNQLLVKASDGDKESLASVSFLYADQPTNELPTVEIQNPENDTMVKGMITIDGVASDDILVNSVYIRIGESNWIRAIGTESWYYYADTTVFDNGRLTIEARSTDGILDSRIHSISVIVDNSISPDNQRPVVTIFKPVENEEVINDLTSMGTTEDDQSGSRTYYRLNGGNWLFISDTVEWEIDIDVSDESTGPHLISFVAFDAELRSEIIDVDINKIEYKPMNVTIEYPLSSSLFYDNLRLSGIVTDGYHVQKIEIRIDSGTWLDAVGTISWSYDYNAENTPFGEVVFSVRAMDDFGYSDIVNVKANHTISDVDYIPPLVAISEPKDGDIITGNLVVAGTVEKGVFEIEQVELRLNTGEWIALDGTINWTFSYSWRLLEPGDITIEVRAYDGHSFTTPESVHVTYDDSTPTSTENTTFIILIILLILIIIAFSIVYIKRKGSIN